MFDIFKKLYDDEKVRLKDLDHLSEKEWKNICMQKKLAVRGEKDSSSLPDSHWLKLRLQEAQEAAKNSGSVSKRQNRETELILRDLLDWKSGHMKMVRLCQNVHASALLLGLRLCRDRFFTKTVQRTQPERTETRAPFAVLVDNGSISLKMNFLDDIPKIDPCLKGKIIKQPQIEGRQLSVWPEYCFYDDVLGRGKTLRAILHDKKDLLYDDLEGLPCILLLVDKGRKGDTFPQVRIFCLCDLA